ncbi:MAG: tetratricopeptide repeat protein [Planctomycetota bacterium]
MTNSCMRPASIEPRGLYALPALALLFLFPACFGLSEKEETALTLYKQNSKSYYNTGKYDETIDQCYKGLELDDDDFSLNLTLAWALLRAGGKANIFAAYNQFQKVLDSQWFDEDYRALLGMGETSYRIATLYNKKLEEYERRLEADPGSEELFLDEMEACREGKARYLEEAKEYLAQVLENERHTENVDALLILGQVHAYGGDHDQAVECIVSGLELLERSTSFQQSKLDMDKSITGDGRRFFERQIKRNLKSEKELRGLLAFVYQLKGQYGKALVQYNLLKDRDLFDYVQYYNRGVCLQELGRYEEAIREYETYLSKASVTGRDFDEDVHFHKAFERINTCRKMAKNAGGQPGGHDQE